MLIVASAKQHQFAEYERLSAEQLKLGRFRPWVQHASRKALSQWSFMLADFNTIEEIAQKMIQELDR